MSLYYQHQRTEIQPLLPPTATNILEIGAATGATLKWLKTIYPTAITTGVEINSALFDELEQNADFAILGNIEDRLPQLKTYDLILLLDVLEHLTDSAKVLRSVQQLLEPQGHVIVSLPNIAHLSVSIPLLFRRRFSYRDAGILDRTHLRFFVEETAISLLNEANLVVTKGLVSGLQGPKTKVIHRLSLGLLRHYLAKQYIMLGRASNAPQQPIKWMIAG